MPKAFFRKAERHGALQFLADRVELVRELLAPGSDRDLAPGLRDQAPRDILCPLECDAGGWMVEYQEGIQDSLHLLQVGRGELDVPTPQVLERESAQFAHDVAEAEEVGGVRHPDVLRTRKALALKNGVDEEGLAGLLHRVLDDAGVIEVRMVLEQAPEFQDLLAGLL